MKKNNKDKRSFSSMLLTEMFGGREKMYMLEEEMVDEEQLQGVMEEEAMQSPFMTTVNTFFSIKTAVFGLVVFLLIFLAVLIGPRLQPIDLSYSEVTQAHIAPGYNLMDIPENIEKDLKEVSVGPSFSIGITNSGDLAVWGKPEVSRTITIADVPEDMGNVVKVAAGYDHAIALNDEGEIFAWGSDRQGQARITPELEKLDNIKDVVAGYQLSIIVTEDGHTYGLGNMNNNDYDDNHEYQGQIDKVTANSSGVLGLTKSGEVVYLGRLNTVMSNVPEIKGKAVDIGSTANTMAAVDENGELYVWGNMGRTGLADTPESSEIDGKVVKLGSGRNHYTGVTDTGNAVAWGLNNYDQAEVPEELRTSGKIKDLHTGYYQNYAIMEDGTVERWGLRGYIWGTDELGRDIFNRVLNGGKMTITIGMIATVISTVIGIIVGGISGYFGGTIDQILQRLAEMVGSLPTLPLLMVLNSILGNRVTPDQKIKLVMVLLGVLGWTGLQRLVRSQVLSIREQEYVTAARSVGIKQRNIIFKHIIPNVISVIVVSTTLRFAGNMLTEASLSFLGFGVLPPQPTWGNMLDGAKSSIVIQNYWWRWVFTSAVLSITVISINLVGDGLRDAIDPRSQER